MSNQNQQHSEASTGLTIKADPRAMALANVFSGPKFQASLRSTLPKHLDAGRMVRLVLGTFQTTPRLLECTPESVILSVMRSAAMGLEPDGVLGQGYLVPFYSTKNRRYECQFIPGYRGLAKLARQSGEVADVWAEVVWDCDCKEPGLFTYELGLHPTLRHVRNDETTDRGKLRYVYAVARFRDGERKFVVMNRAEVEAIKAGSQSRDKEKKLVGPWVEYEAEMWKKTAVRRLCKLLPMSVDADRYVREDEQLEGTGELVTFDSIEVPAIEGPASTDPAATTTPEGELFRTQATAQEAGV